MDRKKTEKWWEETYKCRRPQIVNLWANRNTSIYDDEGKQIAALIGKITCYGVDHRVALDISEAGGRIYLGKWGAWQHEINADEWLFLLGLGTHVREKIEKEWADAKGKEKE